MEAIKAIEEHNKARRFLYFLGGVVFAFALPAIINSITALLSAI